MKFQERLYAYLRDNDIPFVIQHVAPSGGPAGPADTNEHQAFVRTDFAFVGNQLTMLALCADRRVDISRLQQALHRPDIALVDTGWLRTAFPDVDIEAIPPLGMLWQLPVIVDARLCDRRTMTFYAGDQRDQVTLTRADFERLTRPAVLDFSAAVKSGALVNA